MTGRPRCYATCPDAAWCSGRSFAICFTGVVTLASFSVFPSSGRGVLSSATFGKVFGTSHIFCHSRQAREAVSPLNSQRRRVPIHNYKLSVALQLTRSGFIVMCTRCAPPSILPRADPYSTRARKNGEDRDAISTRPASYGNVETTTVPARIWHTMQRLCCLRRLALAFFV